MWNSFCLVHGLLDLYLPHDLKTKPRLLPTTSVAVGWYCSIYMTSKTKPTTSVVLGILQLFPKVLNLLYLHLMLIYKAWDLNGGGRDIAVPTSPQNIAKIVAYDLGGGGDIAVTTWLQNQSQDCCLWPLWCWGFCSCSSRYLTFCIDF